MGSDPVYVGVDVGAEAKGFHAVALHRNEVIARHHAADAREIHAWCVSHDALAVGVDAPCRWRSAREPRKAEREMAQEKIFCFATPSEDAARRTAFHRWMLNGAALYAELDKDFALYDGRDITSGICFETFPQAIACALAGRVLSATRKRFERKVLLEKAGVKTATLTSIDYVDAALCALTARHLVEGRFKAYGDRETGYIVVPKAPESNPIARLRDRRSLRDLRRAPDAGQ